MPVPTMPVAPHTSAVPFDILFSGKFAPQSDFHGGLSIACEGSVIANLPKEEREDGRQIVERHVLYFSRGVVTSHGVFPRR